MSQITPLPDGFIDEMLSEMSSTTSYTLIKTLFNLRPQLSSTKKSKLLTILRHHIRKALKKRCFRGSTHPQLNHQNVLLGRHTHILPLSKRQHDILNRRIDRFVMQYQKFIREYKHNNNIKSPSRTPSTLKKKTIPSTFTQITSLKRFIFSNITLSHQDLMCKRYRCGVEWFHEPKAQSLLFDLITSGSLPNLSQLSLDFYRPALPPFVTKAYSLPQSLQYATKLKTLTIPTSFVCELFTSSNHDIKLPHLEYLEFVNREDCGIYYPIGEPGLRHLAEYIHLPELKSLILSATPERNTLITENKMKYLLDWVLRMPKLQTLNLCHTPLPSTTIINQLAKSPILSQLSSFDLVTDRDGWEALLTSPWLSMNKNLTRLTIPLMPELPLAFPSDDSVITKCCCIHKKSFQRGTLPQKVTTIPTQLIRMMSQCEKFSNLRELDLGPCEPIAISYLCNSPFITQLTALNFTHPLDEWESKVNNNTNNVNNNIEMGDNIDLHPQIQSLKLISQSNNMKSLLKLDPGWSTIPSIAFKYLAESKYVTQLKNFGCCTRSITLNCFKAPATPVTPSSNSSSEHFQLFIQSPNVHNLETISLKNSNLSEEALDALSQSKFLTNLQLLDITCNPLSNPNSYTQKLFSSSFSSIINLTHLYLANNNLNDCDLYYIANSPLLRKVKRLCLQYNPDITDVGIHHLSQSPYITQLESLNIKDNINITGNSLKYLSKAPFIENLCYLFIGDTSIDDHDLQLLTSSPRCKCYIVHY